MSGDQLLELSPYLALAILFAVPYVDPRRPFRLLHLDILVLSSFGLYSIALLDRGPLVASIRWSTVIAAAGLLYILARSSYAVLRPEGSTHTVLSRVPLRWLTCAMVIFMGFRLLFPFFDDRLVIDVGLASVAGARQILEGEDLYGAEWYEHPNLHPDTYGPVNYLLYVPFASVISSPQHAARAATDVFDLLMLGGAILLGRRVGGRSNGRTLGVLLGYSWATSPYAFFTSIWAYNDSLVALALVFAVIWTASPWARATILGLGAATKFVPAVVWALFLFAPGGTRSTRILAAAASVGLAGVMFALFMPDGGVRELYDRTAGWQLERQSPLSLWAQFEFLTPFRAVAVGLVAVLAGVCGIVARRLSPLQIVASTVALVVAFQLSLAHWLPSYIVWFAPLFMVLVLAPLDPRGVSAGSRDDQSRRPASDGTASKQRADPADDQGQPENHRESENGRVPEAGDSSDIPNARPTG